MTALAQAPERAAMRVVPAVARIAIRGQRDLGDIPGGVAGLTIEAAMRAGQPVSRLRVVIEAPPRPAIRVVAEPAIRREAALMMLIRMAGDASRRRILERQRPMAFLAGHDGVSTDQRKTRHVVIEGHYAAPARLSVTLLATATELTFVPVILAVAGHTGRRQLVAIEIAGVAGIALDVRMCGSQRKLGRLAVVEADRVPLALVVAALALGPVAPAMHVLNSVAVHACGADVLVALVQMAGGAGHGTMRRYKREFGTSVIEWLDAAPSLLGMTTLARFPEAAFVRIARLVTIEAACGRGAKLRGFHMTAGAWHPGVCIPEAEIRARVVERLGVQLHDVGISPFMIGVTMGAFLLRRSRVAAVKASSGLAVGALLLVAIEAKLGLSPVRERLVAIAALLLELGVSGRERSGHDKLLEYVLRPPG